MDMSDEIDALVDWQLARGEARGRRVTTAPEASTGGPAEPEASQLPIGITVENPAAIGDPEVAPILRISPELRSLFRQQT
jgi:hypothetical protein